MSTRFLADEMLGDVVKWLRIMGYEAVYKKGTSDRALMEKARRGYVLVTSDRELHRMSGRHGVKCVLLEGGSIEEKLTRVFKELKLKPSLRSTKCTVCGGELQVSRRKLPKRTDSLRVIWTCTRCSKMYWRGSHWINIANMIRKIERRLSEENDKS